MITGPTNIDPAVLRAMSKPPLMHTSPEFARIFKEALENLRKLFMTNGESLIVSGSGTVALEMAIANLVEPGDRILNTVSGLFGQYFVKISQAHGAQTKLLEVPWGKPILPEDVKKEVEQGDYKAVTVTHVDTSTGVANPIKEIGEVVKKNSNALLIVDTVCSLGGMEVRMDDWSIDVCVSGSQKCIGAPTGLGLVAASRKAIKCVEERKTPVSFWYGDFRNWLPIMRDPTLYFATPPVNMIYALHTALETVMKEDLEKRFMRHRLLADAFRASLEAMNVTIAAESGYRADTVTAAYYPDKIEDDRFRREMKRRKVIVLSGVGMLRGKCFRVGHMGNVTQNDIISTVAAIESTLRSQGHTFRYGAGLESAQEVLQLA